MRSVQRVFACPDSRNDHLQRVAPVHDTAGANVPVFYSDVAARPVGERFNSICERGPVDRACKMASLVKRRLGPAVNFLFVKSETQSFYELAVTRAVNHVVASLDGALDLHALARVAALSAFHFHRIFRGMVGETPLEMHRRLRMERAAWHLWHEERSVTAVAFQAGYETHESFTRAFRAHYNCSPSEFRQNARVAQDGCATPLRPTLPARSGIHYQTLLTKPLKLQLNQAGPIMDVQIKDMPEFRVATVAHVGPYNQISEAFARLGKIAAEAHLFGPQAAMIGIYYDDPETTPASELRSDAAIVVSETAALPPGVVERRLPAGRYASTTFVGPYERLGDTWARFMGEWLPRSGQRLNNGVSYEVYRNTPNDVPPEKLVTELYAQLAS